MAYACQSGPGQWIYLDNQGAETVVTVAASSAGQQQQATSRLQTGSWTAAPTVMRSGGGVVVRLETAAGPRYVQVQGTQVATTAAVGFDQGTALPLQEMGEMPQSVMPPMEPMPPMPPMPPMEPMKPMQMGNMQMSLNPMAMQMGNMAMQMGGPTSSPKSQFCTQCGQPLKPEDRFCGQCGHRVNQSG